MSDYGANGRRIYSTKYQNVQRVLKSLGEGQFSVRLLRWGDLPHKPTGWHDPGRGYACVVTTSGRFVGEVMDEQMGDLGYRVGDRATMTVRRPSCPGDPYTAVLLPTSRVREEARHRKLLDESASVSLVQSKESRANLRALRAGGHDVERDGRLVVSDGGRRYSCYVYGLPVGKTYPSAQQDFGRSLLARFGKVPDEIDTVVFIGESTEGRPYAVAYLDQALLARDRERRARRLRNG